MIDIAETYNKYRPADPSLAEGVIYFIHEFGVPKVGYVGRTRNWRARKEVHFDAGDATSYFARSVRQRGKCLVFQKLEIVARGARDSDREWYWMERLQSEGVELVNRNKPRIKEEQYLRKEMQWWCNRAGNSYGQVINKGVGYYGSKMQIEQVYADLLEEGLIQFKPSKAKNGVHQPTQRILNILANEEKHWASPEFEECAIRGCNDLDELRYEDPEVWAATTGESYA